MIPEDPTHPRYPQAEDLDSAGNRYGLWTWKGQAPAPKVLAAFVHGRLDAVDLRALHRVAGAGAVQTAARLVVDPTPRP